MIVCSLDNCLTTGVSEWRWLRHVTVCWWRIP